jgi:hypothetical protein
MRVSEISLGRIVRSEKKEEGALSRARFKNSPSGRTTLHW